MGVTLLGREDPFWWRREISEEEKERLRVSAERERKAKEDASGDKYGGVRRGGMLRKRSPGDDRGGEERGGYTDLEVLEVLDPVKAARIHLRNARCTPVITPVGS